MSKITSEKEAKYVASQGSQCLHCGGSSMGVGNIEIEGNIAYATITCDDCGEKWDDMYKLFAVTDYSE